MYQRRSVRIAKEPEILNFNPIGAIRTVEFCGLNAIPFVAAREQGFGVSNFKDFQIEGQA